MFCPTFVLFGDSMATFRKRSNGWQARIQRKGYPDLAKTFKTHTEAVNWAKEIEYQIYKGLFHQPIQTKEATLGELLIKYQHEITPLKKSIKPELYRIQAWLKSPYADRYVSNLRSTDFAGWRDLRLKQGKAGNTVKLELALISHLYYVARAEWGFEELDNPIRYIRKPKLARGRTRRASDEEISLIIENTESVELPFIILLALETGMRRGEIASIRWSDINFEERFIQLRDTKNGEDRKVPLSSKALRLIESIPHNKDEKLFGMTSHAISYAFIRATRRVGLEDLHFHDLRHEAISRMFEKHLNVMEVGAISGHKTLQMLKRYTHLNPKELALKLD